jgi:xanthine dehydrogenase accessory factor
MYDYLDHAQRLRQAGQPFVLATVVRAERPTSAKPGARGLVTADGKLHGWVGGSCAEPTVIREAKRALADGEPRLLRLCPPERMTGQQQPGVVETVLTCASGGTLEIYLEPHLAQPQLVVISHQPIAQALTAVGAALGFAVTVAGVEATPERFPQARRVLADLKFDALTVTPHTYIVVASHGNYDEDALEWALRTDAAYIALVASPRRAASVRAYLAESGLSTEQLARLKAPAGLDLGAVTPEEIALSVLAEIVQVRRQRTGAPHGTRTTQHDSPGPDTSEPPTAIDPVCGMTVEMAGARYTAEHAGQTYYFCCPACRRTFQKDPAKYAPA